MLQANVVLQVAVLQVLAELGLGLLGHIELLGEVQDGHVVVVAPGLAGLADTLLLGFLLLLAALLLLGLGLQAVGLCCFMFCLQFLCFISSFKRPHCGGTRDTTEWSECD